ncbi:MAG TPA: phenylalanine--tRNA ligase subunit alpha [Rhodospirillaceae bacterium]|jgi:phenylalanyl-tRNA synthetase alpha chain|nr:phenylalanine--tRNA ligase subunit alpha [Alphaproteobacteria bacterium]HBH25854.1 phenylalanine--tRNA ligase subunit alpha [Rhodospirillaceae bacterium]
MDVLALQERILAEVSAAGDAGALEAVRVAALGKKGSVTEALKRLGGMTPEERRERGPALNALKAAVAGAIESRRGALEAAALDARLATEAVDVTLPIRPERRGHIHPLTRTMENIAAIFGGMGFSRAEGPDVEDDWHNFTALNFPPDHPAREMQDTFFLDKAAGRLLRTHTSPVQIRHMQERQPPFRVISLGRTYRCDSDATHSPMFHQVEALYVDKGVHMGHLKGCLARFLAAYFGVEEVPMRLRPSFFPFVEPGAEVDIRVPGADRWLEVLGCGMVHPNVLKNCGIDPDQWQGFALGAGLERLTMLKLGISDLRPMFASDPRWLAHYGEVA